MFEPYQWLVENNISMNLGFKEENISSASVDLELGEVQRWSILDDNFIKVNPKLEIKPKGEGKGKARFVFRFIPGFFYLCSTLEYIKVPSTHCAFVQMRSSLARKGLGHKMAGFIDPGFEGNITLELSTDIDLHIALRDRIVQVIYGRLSEETNKPYVGKYLKQRGATPSYS